VIKVAWYLTFEEATVELMKKVKQGTVDGDNKEVVVEQWKGEETEEE
jgi:hypothetical protein